MAETARDRLRLRAQEYYGSADAVEQPVQAQAERTGARDRLRSRAQSLYGGAQAQANVVPETLPAQESAPAPAQTPLTARIDPAEAFGYSMSDNTQRAIQEAGAAYRQRSEDVRAQNTAAAEALRAQGSEAAQRGRLGNIISGAANSGFGSNLNALATLIRPDEEFLETQFGPQSVYPAGRRLIDAATSASDKLRADADEFSTAGQESSVMAKEGLGIGGSMLVDAGVSGTQLASDIAIATLTGGSAMVPMAIRAFGSGAQGARLAGASEKDQLEYGLLSAGIEVLTEKISNVALPFKKFGKGTLDDAIEGAIKKAATTARGQAALKMFISGVSEAGEEFIGAVADPVAQWLTYNEAALSEYGEPEFWEDALGEAIVGGILGLAGGSVDVAQSLRGDAATANAQNAQLNIDNAVVNPHGSGYNGGDGSDIYAGHSERTGTDARSGISGVQGDLGADARGRENGRGNLGVSGSPVTAQVRDTLNKNGVVDLGLRDSSGDSATFVASLTAAREADAKNGWAVSPQTAESLQAEGVKTYLSADGFAGVGVKADGDITALFKSPESTTRLAVRDLMAAALENGGNRLDCYGTDLVKIYAQQGFVPVARVAFNAEYANAGWTADKGSPDIFFMMHNGDSVERVSGNFGKYPTYTLEQLNALPLMEYDAAYSYRDGLLAAAAKETQKQPEALPSGVGAASAGSEGGMGPTKPTRFDINDQMNVDLGNLPEPSNRVVMTPQSSDTGARQKLSDAYTRTVDSLNPIVKFSKAAGDRTAMLASNSRGASGTVTHIFESALVDAKGNPIGESLKAIASKIPQGNEAAFWDYMMHRRNRSRAQTDTNIIANYNHAMSQQYVQNVEAQNPSWKQIGDDITSWLSGFTQAWSVDTGLLDQAVFNNMQNLDPDYVPAQREFTDIESARTGGETGRKFVDLANPTKKLEGSTRDINNPLENIMRLVNTTVKTARYNEVGQSMLDTIRKNPMPQYAEIISEAGAKASSASNIVSVWENGERQYMRINDARLLKALEGLPKGTESIPVASQLTQTFKDLTTQKNLLFGFTNFARDLPTGYVYGSQINPFTYLTGQAKAFRQIAKGSPEYQRYKAVGGGMSSFFTSANAETAALNLTKTKSVLQKIGAGVETFNNMIEESTRLNEFNAVFAKTGDVQLALDASNEVTVNFARGGDITKRVDRNLVPYLNASIQGLDKLGKAFKPQRIGKTLLTGAMGITLPSLILFLANRDNPYYEELSNRTKDNYFCIPNKFGELGENGTPMTFIKIPKSRELGVIFGSLAERVVRAVDGDEDAFDGLAMTFATNIAPANPLDSGLAGPFIGLRSNKDFAGRTIVPQSVQGRSPHLQYDEKTSELTKFIAAQAAKLGVELSPKQMDYLIDSWTGVVGDFLLPITTKGASPLSPVSNRFIADPRYSSQTLADFYENMRTAAQKASDRSFAGDADPDVQTIESKVSSNYSKASREITALSEVSRRAGIDGMTDEDRELLRLYEIDAGGSADAIQKAIRTQQIKIAREADERGKRADEMELDINNNSTIAKTVEKYRASGISERQAYNLYKALQSGKVTMNTSEGKYAFVKEVTRQRYTQAQTTALVASLYTTHDADGSVKNESLLSDLGVAPTLIALYIESEETDLISMAVPNSFSHQKVEYVLTDDERKLFRQTYVDYFNSRATNVTRESALLKIKGNAYDLAKQAVMRGRR